MTTSIAQADRAESRMEVLIGWVLLAGVTLSAFLVIVGLAWRLIETGELGADYTLPKTNFFHFVVANVRAIATERLAPRLLINLGVAVLMLTPFVRVAASLFFFLFAERNWKYSVFTAFVLAVLTYSLFLR